MVTSATLIRIGHEGSTLGNLNFLVASPPKEQLAERDSNGECTFSYRDTLLLNSKLYGMPPAVIILHKSAKAILKKSLQNNEFVSIIEINSPDLHDLFELRDIAYLHLDGKILIPDASSLSGNDSFVRGIKNDLHSLKISLTRKVIEWKQRLIFRFASM